LKGLISATFASPFISRNHLYLFYGHDYSRFLLVPLTGTSCGKCEIRRTQGLHPPEAYMSKTVQCFDDFALIYANQNVRNLRPNFYLLNLTNLTWYPLNLMLSHHFPNGNISLQKCGEHVVYLHGDCNQSNCIERTHLYQIDVAPLTTLLIQKRRSKSLNSLNRSDFSVSDQNKRSSIYSTRSTTSSDAPCAPVSSSQATPKSSVHTPPRFQKKSAKEETKRRYSNITKGSISSVNSNEVFSEAEPLKRCEISYSNIEDTSKILLSHIPYSFILEKEVLGNLFGIANALQMLQELFFAKSSQILPETEKVYSTYQFYANMISHKKT
ncbi:hypothetical protein ANCCAN_10486, partial [Ancylostoma caninum]